MIITTVHSNPEKFSAARNRRAKAGVSLVELMIALSIASVLLVMVTAVLISFSQWSYGLGNYLAMNQQSRQALEVMGRDFRMASVVNEISDDRVSFSVPTAGGGLLVIRYEIDAGNGTVRRVADGESRVILDSVNDINFQFFNVLGAESTLLSDVKVVQVNAEMQRRVLAATNTNYLISARFTMRNKIVGS